MELLSTQMSSILVFRFFVRELLLELCVHEPRRRGSSGLGGLVRSEQVQSERTESVLLKHVF